MANQRNIAVIGAGSWGTAVANTFADGGGTVTIWGRDSGVIKSINEAHRNPRYLSAFPLAPTLRASSDLEATVRAAGIVVCAVPTQQIRSVFAPLGETLAGRVLVNTSKGIEQKTNLRISEIFADIAPRASYAALSGPSFAEEVVQRMPTAVTIACETTEIAEDVQRAFSTSYMRAYTTDDVIGVELAGALKNVIAVATGVAAGLGLGLNTQAALINRGVAEIVRLARAQGANPMTFLGLAGMGDLVLTCTGDLSRNRRLGIALGKGLTFEAASKELGGVAEGAFTVRAAHDLAEKRAIEMPVTEQVYRILYGDQTPKQALAELMTRNLKVEWDLV